MNSPVPKPDYEGFCTQLEEWDRNNVCYSLRDMAELALHYHCPIPEEYRQRFQDLVRRSLESPASQGPGR
jgi:hypothetical protein